MPRSSLNHDQVCLGRATAQMTHSTLEDFLLDHPDELASWSVYRDRLLEAGDPLALLDESVGHARLSEQLFVHREALLGPWWTPGHHQAVRLTWRHGFVEAAAIDWPGQQGADLARLLLASPVSRFLDGLTLLEVVDASLRVLAEARPPVRTLSFEGPLGPGDLDVAPLRALPRLAGLWAPNESLRLTGEWPSLTVVAARRLVALGDVPSLSRLELVSPDLLEVVLPQGRLRSLRVVGRISEAFVETMLRVGAPSLERVDFLRLSAETAATLLAHRDRWPRLASVRPGRFEGTRQARQELRRAFGGR